MREFFSDGQDILEKSDRSTTGLDFGFHGALSNKIFRQFKQGFSSILPYLLILKMNCGVDFSEDSGYILKSLISGLENSNFMYPNHH